MRLIFAGTPEFSRQALASLHEAGHTIVAVLTQPDRPAGRGMKLCHSPVKQLALELGLPVLQPQTLRHPVIQTQLKTLKADAMIVAAYGLILPQEVLETPRFGCLNIHASLLPRWRGAAPIQRAIEAGDSESGITIMQMDEGLDTGDILLMESLPLESDETAATLHDKLARLGADLMVYALQRLEQGLLTPAPQPEKGASYAAKIQKDEARIDWTLPSRMLDRRIRAFNPAPGAWTTRDGEVLKVWKCQAIDGKGTPGTVLRADEDGLVVACGEGALRLLEVQQAGGKRLASRIYLAGHPLAAGSFMGS